MGTGTLVTIFGFLPFGFAQSTAGEYTFSLFAVVAVALIVSWFVAAIFAPLVGMVLLKEAPKTQTHAEPGRVARSFRNILVGAMRVRYLTVIVAVGLLAASVLGIKLVPQQFFPASDRVELLVDLKLPQNSSIHATEKVAAELDSVIRADQDVARWSTYVGSGAVRFYLPMMVELPNDFFAQSVVVTKDIDARERVRKRLEKVLEERFPSVVARVSPLELGPPVGWPVQYRVSGPDTKRVREIAYDVANLMGKTRGVKSISYDWIETTKNLRVELDQDQAKSLGLSSQYLAEQLNAILTGINVTQIPDGNYLIDVVARSGAEDRLSLATLNSLQISTPSGRQIPLRQVATISYGQEQSLIWRRDRMPTLTVQADVTENTQPDTVVRALHDPIAELNAKLPAGYKVVIGGTAEESATAQKSVYAVVPLMLFLIVTVLMLQLQSFQSVFLVVSAVPFGLIGVVAALLLSGKPFGFIAMLGVIALIGMIVRNSVVLIVQIDADIARGMHPWDAVIDATMHRFRPIMLTAAAAILGMIPIAPTVFWAPMAYAIMGGLAAATVVTLIVLPALYVIWFRIRPPDDTTAKAA